MYTDTQFYEIILEDGIANQYSQEQYVRACVFPHLIVVANLMGIKLYLTGFDVHFPGN